MRNILFTICIILCLSLVCCTTAEKKSDSLTIEQTTQIMAKAIELGNTISLETQKVMGGKLKAEIQSGGVPGAINYCNLAAYPIVDSMEGVYQTQIKRATLRARNPGDLANDHETKRIQEYETQISKGTTPQPHVEIMGDRLVYYKPILLTDVLCLHCHGQAGTDISSETAGLIKNLYPEDNASGHRLGDLRGIWSISFEKELLLSKMEED